MLPAQHDLSMYESLFGITGPPFQLSPDPDFYFDSRGHHKALAELRRGLTGDSGFLVFSGEIGAGKTMIARHLVAALDATTTVAQIVSSALAADEVLTAVLLAFGIRADAAGGESGLVALHRFLRKLDKAGHRALLIIDEAQNLPADALLELLSLATPRTLRRLPLLVCLIGQPELRTTMALASLAPLREALVVSCHLGPIERGETGAYVEHRLKRVGWQGNPSFEPGAFEEIHRWTGGVPRLINQLCNRLMLSRYLAGSTVIDAACVLDAAQTLRAEIGGDERTEAPSVPRDDARAPRAPLSLPSTPGPLLCVVSGASEHIKAAALMRALQARPELPPARLVRAHDNDGLELSRSLFKGLDVDKSVVELGIPDAEQESTELPELAQMFDFVVDQLAPKAAIFFDDNDAALACARAAQRKGVRVVHADAGLRLARRSIAGFADLLYCSDASARASLLDQGLTPERALGVGSLVADAVLAAVNAPTGPPQLADDNRNGYALVVLDEAANVADRQVLRELLAILRDVSRDLPLVWLTSARVEAQLKRFRLDGDIAEARVSKQAQPPYAAYAALLHQATCVLTDMWRIQEEATVLGVPCLTIGTQPARPVTVLGGSNTAVGLNRALATRVVWDAIFNGGKRGRPPEGWDGHAGARLAAHLASWLLSDPSPSAVSRVRDLPHERLEGG